jgi:hypothetical protein
MPVYSILGGECRNNIEEPLKKSGLNNIIGKLSSSMEDGWQCGQQLGGIGWVEQLLRRVGRRGLASKRRATSAPSCGV